MDDCARLPRVRVCLAYDCLYPYTVGGAERWYRSLAERLAADGHEVTYLTRLQWDRERSAGHRRRARRRGRPAAASSTDPTGTGASGRRCASEAASCAICCAAAATTTSSTCARFPTSPSSRRRWRGRAGATGLVVDWFEVWSRDYWREYLGRLGGLRRLRGPAPLRARAAARAVLLAAARARGSSRRACAASTCSSAACSTATPTSASRVEAEPLVVFAGRHIAEKRAPAAVEAIALARADGLDVRGRIFGDGPERPAVLAAIDRHGLGGVVDAPGFVDRAEVDDAMRRALCLLHPSAREGYGLVVIESSAHGTPVVVAAGPDNSAVELVDPGENGFVAASADPAALAAAMLEVSTRGTRAATAHARMVRAQRAAASRSRARWSASPRATRGASAVR